MMTNDGTNDGASARIDRLARVPMGPALRTFVGLPEGSYRGDTRQEPVTPEEYGFLVDTVLGRAERDITNEETLIDLMDELVAMDLPAAALELHRKGRGVWTGEEFRGQLALGVAAMLTGDLDRAEEALGEAQALMPEEPAPYVNLAQIMLHRGASGDARTWIKSGLDADPNHLRLWDLLGYIESNEPGVPPDAAETLIKEEAVRRNSWAGLSLAAELAADGDPLRKLRYLEPLYDRGERDPSFLVEFTAALGVAGEYARIPAVVWDARKRYPVGLPWQLYAHGAQAQAALGKADEARPWIEAAERDASLPPEARTTLRQMLADLEHPHV